MNKSLPGIIFTIFLFASAYLFPVAHAYATPNLQFTPTSVTAIQNTTFQVDVRINVDTNNTLASDVVINYASDDLEVISITNGGFFPQFNFAPVVATMHGAFEIHGYSTSGDSNITGTGSFAKIVFKGKKSSGSSAISITCTGGTDSTNILTTSGTNILSCTQINQVSVNYMDDEPSKPPSSPTPTLPAGTTPTSTSTPTPTQKPGTNTIPYCASISTDISIVQRIPQEITLSCSGVDSDGYINGAEFWFGDGTSQLISRNVGSPGTVTTTHTYTKAGLYKIECKVRDNNQIYSQLPDVCKKIITVQQKTVTPTPKKLADNSTNIFLTPTPQVISIIEETPEPTPEPEITPTIEEDTSEENTESPLRFLWILAGIIPAILIIRLFKHRRQTSPPMPTSPVSEPPQYPEPKF